MQRLRQAWQALEPKKQRYIVALSLLWLLVGGSIGIYRTWIVPGVVVETVTTRAMRVGVTETASTMAAHVETVTPKFTAKLDTFPVKVGDIVQQGQVLATVNRDSLQEQLKVLRASLDAVGTSESVPAGVTVGGPVSAPQADLAHAQSLLQQGLITQREYQRLEARAYHGAAVVSPSSSVQATPSLDAVHIEQRIRVLEGLVQDGKILAPMAGRIGAIYNQEQQLAVEGQPLFTIQQVTPIIATVVLPVILPDTQLLVFLKGPSGEVEGQVLQVIRQGAQTIVKGVFPNTDGKLVPGQFYTMSVRTQVLAEELAVPSDAVHHKENTNYVYVLTDDNRVDARLVTVGAVEEGYTAIIQGLQDGDRVICATRDFTLGMRVRPE